MPHYRYPRGLPQSRTVHRLAMSKTRKVADRPPKPLSRPTTRQSSLKVKVGHLYGVMAIQDTWRGMCGHLSVKTYETRQTISKILQINPCRTLIVPTQPLGQMTGSSSCHSRLPFLCSIFTHSQCKYFNFGKRSWRMSIQCANLSIHRLCRSRYSMQPAI